MRVWIVETGEYEQRCIVCVAVSPKAAMDHVKSRYNPHIARWGDLERDTIVLRDGTIMDRGGFRLVGDECLFEITPYDLVGSTQTVFGEKDMVKQ